MASATGMLQVVKDVPCLLCAPSPITPSPRTSEHVGGKAIAAAKYAPVNRETAQIVEISDTGLSALKKGCTVQEATVLTISSKKYKQLLDM